MTCTMILSIHDVAPATWDQTRSWLAHLDARGLPATLLVVAGPWRGPRLDQASDVIEGLHTACSAGHEISLHGWDHAAAPLGRHQVMRSGLARIRVRGCGEFATLDSAAALRRLARGLEILHRSGFTPTGFTPPGWLASPGTLEAMRSLPLRYTTSQWAIRDLRTWRRIKIPALSHRPGSSLAGVGARSLLAIGRHRLDTGRALRLALHPDDLHDRRLVNATLALIEIGLDKGARFMTYDAAVRRRIPTHVEESHRSESLGPLEALGSGR
jgi:predicted deacetylase